MKTLSPMVEIVRTQDEIYELMNKASEIFDDDGDQYADGVRAGLEWMLELEAATPLDDYRIIAVGRIASNNRNGPGHDCVRFDGQIKLTEYDFRHAKRDG